MGIVRAVGRMWKSRVHRNEGVSLSRIWRYVRRSVWSNGPPIYPDAIINEYATLRYSRADLSSDWYAIHIQSRSITRLAILSRSNENRWKALVLDTRPNDAYAGIR